MISTAIPVDLFFKKRPSLAATAFLALLGSSAKFDAGKPFPQITARQNGVTVNEQKLALFNSICRISASDNLPILYPFAFTYPLLQRILAHREAPLSLFVVLNSRLQVKQYRAINIDERLDIYCSITGHRLREKGLEMDILSQVKVSESTVWENIQTFYYRGRFGPPEENYQPPLFQIIPDAEEKARWYLPSGIGYGFSKVCGDSNPIHYWKTYARLLRFKRDFAQPLLVLENGMKYLFDANTVKAVSLDVTLKAPLYYNSNVILKYKKIDDVIRFDLYTEDNLLPCICGKLKL